MNLKECLKDIETGMAWQEHADWLRDHIARMNLAGIKWWRDKARADAVKVALECQELQTKLTTMTEELRKSNWNRWENFNMAVARREELDECKSAYDLLRKQLRRDRTKRRTEIDALQAELRIAGLEFAVENWRRRTLSAEERLKPPNRMRFGFGVGDTVEEGDCTASSGWTDEFLAEHPEESCGVRRPEP